MFRSLTILLIALLCAGCSQTNRPQHSKPASPSTPKRIVSLTPSHTEVLFALGLEDRVVGVTKWCNYPPEAKKKPKVGDMNTSLERVVGLKPDLVLAHSVLNDTIIRRLKSLDIRVLATDPKTIADTLSDIRLIGRATGKTKEAEKLAGTMEKTIDAVTKKCAGGRRPRVLVVIQPMPLWVGGPKTFVDEMIRFADGQNIAYDAKPGFNTFSTETAISRNPEIIIVGKASEKDQIETSSVWRHTKAVQDGKVIVIDPALLVRPGPRLALGLEKLAEAIGTADVVAGRRAGLSPSPLAGEGRGEGVSATSGH